MAFEVSGHTPVGGDPGQRSLDDPALGQNLETLGRVGAADDLDRPRCRVSHPVARVSAIADDRFEERKARRQFVEQAGRAVAVLNAGGMDIAFEHQAHRIGQDVPFASLDLLARIVTHRPLGVGAGLHRLAVDDGRARLRGAISAR